MMEIDDIGQRVFHPVSSLIPYSFKSVYKHKNSPESLVLSCQRTLHSWMVRSVILDTASDLWWATCVTVKWIIAQKLKHDKVTSYLLIVLENAKGAQSTTVLLPHVIRVYLFKTPWRRAAHCLLTKATNLNCCLIKRKVAQWINKRMPPQGQDMNDKRLMWMWGKWSMVTIQLKCLWGEFKHPVPVTATFCPRWL